MTTEERPGLPDEIESRIRRCLAHHSVSFAMVYGSVGRGEARRGSDVDLAIELDSLRPEDDGYSDAYLRVRADLDDELPTAVDVVDVHTLSPSFARTVFDDGVVVVGSADRRDELERRLAGARPTVEDARNRVAAAANRLREDTEAGHGTLSE